MSTASVSTTPNRRSAPASSRTQPSELIRPLLNAAVTFFRRILADHDAPVPYRPDLETISVATVALDLKLVCTAPATDGHLKKRIVRTVIRRAIADLDDETADIVIVIHRMVGCIPRIAWLSRPRRWAPDECERIGLPGTIMAAIR
jgi:hypothetical protein